LLASSITISPQPDTQHVPIPRATTAACEVIPPRTVRIPCAAFIPVMSSGDVSRRTRKTFSPFSCQATASSAVNTTLPQAAPGEAPRPLPIGAAALRAAEIDAEVILLAKTIDGVYSADPKVDPSAIKYDTITYTEVLNKNLKVMDASAIAICRDNNIPLLVFALEDPENIVRAVNGDNIGTIVNN